MLLDHGVEAGELFLVAVCVDGGLFDHRLERRIPLRCHRQRIATPVSPVRGADNKNGSVDEFAGLRREVERLRADGVKVLVAPVDQPWGERLAYVEDPEGNTVMLTAAIGGGES